MHIQVTIPTVDFQEVLIALMGEMGYDGFEQEDHRLLAFAGEEVADVFGGAMKFLGAENQVHVGQFINQLLAAALGHAAHEAHNLVALLAAGGADEVLHLVDGFLLGEITDAARVEKDDVGGAFGFGQGIALGDELGGDGFAIALIHLASVSLDENTRHEYWRDRITRF